MMNCERCGIEVPSLSPMRKWCFDCRKRISIEQARVRKLRKRAQLSAELSEKLPEKILQV